MCSPFPEYSRFPSCQGPISFRLPTSFSLRFASWREVWKSYFEVGSSSGSPTCAEKPMHRRDWHTHGEATCVLRTHGQADNKNTQLQQNDSNPRFLILQRAHVVRFSHAHRHTDAHTEATAHPCSAVTLPCVSHMNVELSLMRISPFGLILLNSLEISTCRFLKIIV